MALLQLILPKIIIQIHDDHPDDRRLDDYAGDSSHDDHADSEKVSPDAFSSSDSLLRPVCKE